MRSEKRSLIQRFDIFDTLAFFAFCMSVPLFLPVFDLWEYMTTASPIAEGPFLPTVTFSGALLLSAMFTALAFLFVCLLKTAHARVSRFILTPAVASYGLGYGLLALWSAGVVGGALVEALCGVMLGFGASVMCVVWVSRLHISEFRHALVVVWLAGWCLFASAALLEFAPAMVARAVLAAMALLSLMGCARLFLRSEDEDRRATQVGSNWWDVFGHLDVSVVEGTGDFKTPLARALFFVVIPFTTLLLFVADDSLLREVDGHLSGLAVAGILAVLAMAPLFRFKTDQALINFSYRFFLPLVAFGVFAASAFVDVSLQRTVMMVGALMFCAVYALVMSAMLVAMAGRMNTLALPAASIMIIMGCVVCLLSNTNVDAGGLGTYRYQALLILFVVLAGALMITPSSRLWRVMLEGIDAVGASASPAQDGYAQRCAELAKTCHLTAREAEILLLLGRGHTSVFVAEELVVAESTVRSHRKNMYRKLGVSSREELFKLLDDATEQVL